MEVHKSSLLALFDSKQRLEVPLFQRQYVWNEEHQWQPLWEDIERKFIEALEGRKDGPNHFLGAMVLDQKQTPTGHVVLRQVIDGQQRLTTLQIFIAAYRDFCYQNSCLDIANECDKFLFNTGMMANPDIDKFKIWPTQLDRQQFENVITAKSREEVLKRYPTVIKKYARKPEQKPQMVQAYLFFFECFNSFFKGSKNELPLFADISLQTRLDEAFQTLRNALMVVVIDLQIDDDPQVIFETLNARGEPLLPADLLRNYLFLRASRADLDIEVAYSKYWSKFDEPFWREEMRQGHLARPRSDLFMQHYLAAQQGQDIPIKHLFVEYKAWIERSKPFTCIDDELQNISKFGDYFKRLTEIRPEDNLQDFFKFLEVFESRSAYPLILTLLDAELPGESWQEIASMIESYIVRRAICNLSNKNYNKTFPQITKNLKRGEITPERLRSILEAQTGDSNLWPDDSRFANAILEKEIYDYINSPRLIYLLSRLNQTFMSSKSEEVKVGGRLTVEHLMPQDWQKEWLLDNDTEGVYPSVYLNSQSDNLAHRKSRERDKLIHTLGNLTILTTSLNPAISNSIWKKKVAEIKAHSLLALNRDLLDKTVWNDAAIMERGFDISERALKIWPK